MNSPLALFRCLSLFGFLVALEPVAADDLPSTPTEQHAIRLAAALSREIVAGVVQVETHGGRIVIRVKEHGSFSSGSAKLAADFKPVLAIIAAALKDMPGLICVEGHTDDVPAGSNGFTSNWALSSARAVSVSEALLQERLDATRLRVSGFADTWPLADNATPEGRGRNRRVDIVIDQGAADDPRAGLVGLRRSQPVRPPPPPQETLIERFDVAADEMF